MDNQLVIVKGYKDGLAIKMDSYAPFEDILECVANRFDRSRDFFKNASFAITFEGRYLSEEDEKAILRTIDNHSDIDIICIVGEDEETNRRFIKAVKRVESQRDDNNCRYYSGDVEEGTSIEAEGNLVVLGDIKPGAVVSSTKDIIVLGGAYGELYAGVGAHEEEHIVIAMTLEPQKLKIGDMLYHEQKEKKLFKSKKKEGPRIVFMKNGVLAEDLYSGDIREYVASI